LTPKQRLIETIDAHLKGFEPLVLITLNSRTAIKSAGAYSKIKAAEDRRVAKMMEWLREKLFGAKGADLMRAVATYEVAPDTKLLHTHIIVATRAEPRQSIDEIRAFVCRKWERFRRGQCERSCREVGNQWRKLMEMINVYGRHQLYPWEVDLNANTDVRPIFDLSGAIKYITKQFNERMREDEFGGFYPV
jgi:hypothetical protein